MVVSIIAILMGISIPRLKGMRDEANVTKAKREVKALQAAVESYRMNHANTLPTTITTDLTGASPKMISAVLPDPFNSTDPTYQYSRNGSYYAISSVGPDGVDATEDIRSTGYVYFSGDDMVVTNGTPDPCSGKAIGEACDGVTAVYAGSGYMTIPADANIGSVSWYDGVDYCNSLGSGWRLPTKDELNDILWVNSNTGSLVGFEWDCYWSSTDYDADNAWYQDFPDGDQWGSPEDGGDKTTSAGIRCVRSY